MGGGNMNFYDSKKCLKVYDKRKWVPLYVKDIYYFHYLQNRRIEAITKINTYQIKNNLSDLYNDVNQDNFFLPHRSFIVNAKHIKQIDKENKILIMKNEDLVPIARRKYSAVFEYLNQYFS